ncbi:MAG: PTS sugar transporter subunit IIA [Candidatus Bathyarchaeia archaeon]
MKLTELLDPELIICNLEAHSTEEALKLLSYKLYEKGLVKASFEQAVLKREREMPTGLPIGDINAAIPHADIEHVIKPSIAIATLAKPLPFHVMIDPDSIVDVKIIFLLALNEPHAQIQMLQTVATILQDSSLLHKLEKAKSSKEIIEILSQVKEI